LLGFVGPLFWPYAFEDLSDYTFSPYAYDAFWPYAFDDVFAGIYGGYAPGYHLSEVAASGDCADSREVCGCNLVMPRFRRRPAQQLRQLGEVHRHAAGFVVGQALGRWAPTGLILEIEIAERLPGGVLHDEACIVMLFDDPRRPEAARGGHGAMIPRSSRGTGGSATRRVEVNSDGISVCIDRYQ